MIRPFIFAIALIFAPAAIAQAYQPIPRTADGHPDLQGNWLMAWSTTLERPPGYATLVITAEDGAKMHAGYLKRLQDTDPLAAEYSWDFESPLAIRGETRSSLLIDPPTGKLPYTAEGNARRAAFRPFSGVDHPEQRANNERCLMAGSGYAPFLAIPASNLRQFVQTKDHLVILLESFAQLRIIPLDGRRGPAIPRGGSSTARWEGDTLVLETSGLLETDRFRQAPLSSFAVSPATRITERLTRTGSDEIAYRYTVEDPLLYTQPWTAETRMKRSPDRVFEFACHESNYGLAGILAGGRAEEKRAAAKVNAKR